MSNEIIDLNTIKCPRCNHGTSQVNLSCQRARCSAYDCQYEWDLGSPAKNFTHAPIASGGKEVAAGVALGNSGSTLVDKVLQERGKQYGDIRCLAAGVQAYKIDFRSSYAWDWLSSVEREALDMIALKINRILNGAPGQVDSWTDIAGYANLAVNDLAKP